MSESRLNKSAKNMVYAFGTKLIQLFLGLFARAIFLFFLSTEYLGISGLFTNVLTILSFAELGIANVMLYNMYKPMRENDTDKLKALLQLYRKSYFIIAAVVFAVGICLVPFIDVIIGEAPSIKEDIKIIYVVYLFNTAVSYLFSYKQTLLLADQRSYIVSANTSILNILKEVFQVIVLFATSSYMMYLIVMVISTVALNVIISYKANKLYPWIKEKGSTKLSTSETKKIFSDVKILAVSKISGVVCNGTGNIIITKIIGLGTVGLVSNYNLIINNLSGLVYGMLQGLVGSIGNLNAGNNKQHQKKIFDEIQMMSYLIYSYISIALICLCNRFISQVWLGTEYTLSLVTCVSLVLIIFQSGMNFPAYTFRTTYGLFNNMQWIYMGTAALNIFLSIAMGKLMGVSGVFFATVLAKAVSSEIGDGYYTYKYGFGINPVHYFVKYYALFALFAINCKVCVFVTELITVKGLIGFIVAGILCTVISNVINIAVLYKTDAFRGLCDKGLELLKKGKPNG